MRTTVDLDEDILRVTKHLAREREQSLGRVLSDLVRQSLTPPRKSFRRTGVIPTLARKPNARLVTSQDVKDLLEAES